MDAPKKRQRTLDCKARSIAVGILSCLSSNTRVLVPSLEIRAETMFVKSKVERNDPFSTNATDLRIMGIEL